MKSAFTLIELIFTIIIIGILVSIAMPKLNTTRTDAKVSEIIANLNNVIIDCASYYSARGEIDWINAKVPEITNVPLFLDNRCYNQVDDNTSFIGNTLYICDDTQDVIRFDANKTHIKITSGKSLSLIAKDIYNSASFKSLSQNNGIRLGGVAVKK